MEGRCFVFDERVALDAELKPMVDQPLPRAAPQRVLSRDVDSVGAGRWSAARARCLPASGRLYRISAASRGPALRESASCHSALAAAPGRPHAWGIL